MKKIILSLAIILSTTSLNAQVKIYNADLPYFNKSNLVKPSKTVKNVNNFTKRVTNITEYNAMGQLHGINIEYRSDTSVGLIRYYHNNKIVYIAQPFMNGNAIQKVFNYNDNGSYNGTQSYTYLNSDNKWVRIEYTFNNGRLSNIDNKFKFPNYTVNFKDGKLNDEFYFYDSIHCSCYYYGNAQDGKIKNIAKFEIGGDLSFKNTYYFVNDKSIKSTIITDYRKPFEENISINEIPVIVENKKILLDNKTPKIIFNDQLDWMLILKEKSIDPSYNSDLEMIDMSDTTFGAPSPYTLPQKQH
ncbi:hypothetical protein [Chryseobacterium sp. Mn2064]|uniref:hypothetical protein n=1 Tax=Chryseobacterium sp. Mn2064 TaxID=3395263 RepID=UPI003BB9EADC